MILRNHLDDLLVPVTRAFQNLFALSKSRNAAKRRRANDRCNRYAHLIATSMAAEKGTWPPASLAGSARIHVRAWLPLPLLSEGLSFSHLALGNRHLPAGNPDKFKLLLRKMISHHIDEALHLADGN
ncbi:hypothetical protein [Heliomarina baculiformis]|uniref:hypothetical protein n=1 Tax=Heliomarina baculiformis TaxID=2872036 RepID=UPI001EE209E4|nr:hypothetical protein [Heliomarina baculiformis]